MKLNKKLQLGLLLVLYLHRSGKTTVASAAEGLQTSPLFLAQVAYALRKKGLIKATKGPNGGYELTGEPTVGEVFNALSPLSLLNRAERQANTVGGNERRSLNHLVVNLTAALDPIMKRKVKNVGAELVASDMARMNRLSPLASTN